MPDRSRSPWKRALAAALGLALALAGRAAAADPDYVILDNDFAGPGGGNIQATLPLLAAPGVTVLGFTVVTGDGWENAESAHLRRMLEIAGRTEVPVVDGAVYPLLNTAARMKSWEQRFGTIPWKGAWGALGSIDAVPAFEPPVPALDEGEPALKPAAETAAAFLIRQVHAHPHQVTVVAAGPLTNLALAIRLDPTFAADAKALVFEGALVDTSLMAVTGNADFATDFNLLFDPEAAHIALTAPWPRIVAVGDVANTAGMTRALMDRIAGVRTPLTAYLSKYSIELPLWDEMTSAVAADPSLVTKSVTATLDVDIADGPDYGRAHVWSAALAPRDRGLRPVELVQAIDAGRFVDGFVRAAQTVGAKP